MKFSIITPTHKVSHLGTPRAGLQAQTHQDYEWIILVNNEGLDQYESAKLEESDGKTKVIRYDTKTDSIGELKKEACKYAVGDVLVELDHDDSLEPTCLEELAKAFEDPEVDFAYSDWFEWRDGKTVKPFSEQYGWKYTELPDGRIVTHAFDSAPLTFSYIWFAPNHVRAWRREFYEKIGGHNPAFDVCDDHELLCRTYTQGKCKCIPKPLYNYYVGDNTCYGEKNKKIQIVTRQLHDSHIESMVKKWCDSNGLKKVDLCCGENKPAGYIGVDIHSSGAVDIQADLNYRWPFDDNSVGLFRVQDAIEHLKDPIWVMRELWRCLVPNGWAMIEVPSTDGRGAFQDPTHVSFWNSNSFWYYTNHNYAKFIGEPVKFQCNRLTNHFPSQFCKELSIPYVKAHLVKLADDTYIPPKGREI